MKLVKRKDVKRILNITFVFNEYATFLNDLLKDEMNKQQCKSLNKMIKKSDMKSDEMSLKYDDNENNDDVKSTQEQMNISET